MMKTIVLMKIIKTMKTFKTIIMNKKNNLMNIEILNKELLYQDKVCLNLDKVYKI